jgi:lysozyme
LATIKKAKKSRWISIPRCNDSSLSSYFLSLLITKGNQMNDIRRLQHALNKAGFGPIDEDGKRGPKTQAALELYQRVRKPYPTGPDVSRWNAKVKWIEVKAGGASFAFCKGTHGTGKDPLFSTNWPAMKAVGLIRGCYHWFSPGVSLVAQADNIYKTVGKLGAGDLPVALDIERDGVGPDGKAGTSDDIKATDQMAEQLAKLIEERTGKKPLIYSYSYYLDERNVEVPSCPLWIADYRSGPPTLPPGWNDYLFHQREGDDGRHPGVEGPCDLNYFKGDLEALRKVAGF